MHLSGNCQDPVHCVGSLKLAPNCASGIATTEPFRSKLGQPTKLWSLGRIATQPSSGSSNPGAVSTLQASISSVYTTWRTADIEARGINLG